MAEFKSVLGSKGYFIAQVARRFSTHGHNFLAIPKRCPEDFILVQMGPHNTLLIRPWASSSRYAKEKNLVKEMQKKFPKRLRWYNQIKPKNKNLSLKHFLTPKGQDELELLGVRLN